MYYLLSAVLGYLLGCSNMALYLSKINRVDVRKGGKGFASYLGVILALNWKFALVILVLVAVVTVVTDYIVAGTTLTILASPVYLAITGGWLAALILCIATAVILCKHRVNYVRMYKGTEPGLRGAVRGDGRVKK